MILTTIEYQQKAAKAHTFSLSVSKLCDTAPSRTVIVTGGTLGFQILDLLVERVWENSVFAPESGDVLSKCMSTFIATRATKL